MPCVSALALAATVCLLSPVPAAGAPPAGPARQRPGDAGDVQAARQAIFEAEDRRAPSDADLAVLRNGLLHRDEDVQRMAVRALGRLERPALVADIGRALSSPSAGVRIAATEALGQAVAAGSGDAAAAVQAMLLKHLRAERDQGVVGTACRTLGRLPYTTAQAARSAEVALLVAALPLDAPQGASLTLRVGVARGLESLLRRHARLFTPSAETVRRLKQLAVDRRQALRGDNPEEVARVRRLAFSALGAAKLADEATIAAAAADPDGQVRRLAIIALAAAPAGALPEPARTTLMAAALTDPDALVRYEALRIHARSLTGGSADWAPVFAAVEDASPHVALLAIDLLQGPQPDRARAVTVLRREAAALPADGQGPKDWHRAAHALVSLARIEPDEASALLPRLEASHAWPARMYAARAAVLLRDTHALTRFARDGHDNVREAAIAGLKTVAGHEADHLYIEALGRPDYQLVMTAAGALIGSPRRAEASAALLAALARITAERRETSRDARLALLARIGELGAPSDARMLELYASDLDPKVAAEASAMIGRWTGQAPPARPSPLPVVVPDLADIEQLRGARARVRVAGRGTFEFELLPDEAPATVARFVSLARAGYYNGLTFHRVVPAFIVQGGSPGANEFAGDGPFMRDEIGLEPHVRGAASISTRGRDTGDAQIWFNLVDNPRLDHEYTVFGRTSAGADVLDRILECDLIERIDILPSPQPLIGVGSNYVPAVLTMTVLSARDGRLASDRRGWANAQRSPDRLAPQALIARRQIRRC
jgi:cyclophilin family peptidyl-prolyl cis-trans isomerase/HEAT repeat protein